MILITSINSNMSKNFIAPVTSFTLGSSLRLPTSGTPSFHCLTGGVYKARERIHRAMADARLLAIPAS
jgi:hypothetical protein